MVQDNSHLAEINPEFAEVLKETGPIPARDFDNDIPTFRASLSERIRAYTAAKLKDIKGVVTRDISVSASDGYKIPCRVYTPESSPSGNPLVIWFHGGGFCLGGLETAEVFCNELVQAHGVSAVNVDYRLAPEWKFPHAATDGWDVVRWAAANPAEVGADLSKGFIVGGASAGGNIAAVATHLARDEHLSPPLTGAALLIPMLAHMGCLAPEHAAEIKSYSELPDAPFLPAKTIDTFLASYAPDPKSHLNNLFAPPINFDNLPTHYFQVCGWDPLRDEALLYERLLREKHGCKTKLQVYPGLPHGFWGFVPKMKCSLAFIQDTVEGVGWLLEEHKTIQG